MKKLGWILLGIVGTIIILFIAYWAIYARAEKAINNPDVSNKNLTFVGNDNRLYDNTKSFQNMDGSFIIASSLAGIRNPQPVISLMKLSAAGKLMWEKHIHFTKFTLWDLLPGLIRKDKGVQHLNILGINNVDNKYYLLLNRYNRKVYEPYILIFNSDGKRLSTKKVKLQMVKIAPAVATMHEKFAWLSYLDLPNKMLCLAKLDIKTGEVLNNSMLFFKQNRLYQTAIAADQADTTVAITAYDRKAGCSFYEYSKTTDLKEYFRTKPTSKFTVLKYIGDKLYSVVKEDSLLDVVDVTDLQKPLIIMSEKPAFKDFIARDLQIINGNIYVTFDAESQKGKSYLYDTVIHKYTSFKELPKEYLIQGKGAEQAINIYGTNDKQIMVIGQSTSTAGGKGMRVFATKFAL